MGNLRDGELHTRRMHGSVLESTKWQDGGHLASISLHLIPFRFPSTKQTVTLLRDYVIRVSRHGLSDGQAEAPSCPGLLPCQVSVGRGLATGLHSLVAKQAEEDIFLACCLRLCSSAGAILWSFSAGLHRASVSPFGPAHTEPLPLQAGTSGPAKM